MERLSSGLRVNSAKDDAAGLAITDRMTSQIRGLNQAARNSYDGISLAQTAEGALQETTNLLQRMRELAVQSANDTNSSTDRDSLQAEFDQLKQEISRIANTTSFNTKNILNGTFQDVQFQIGANAKETLVVSIPSTQTTNLGNHALTTTHENGIEVSTFQTYFAANGSSRGAIGALDVIGSSTNGLTAETLTILDAVGDYVGEASVSDNENLTAHNGLIETLNGIEGVTATGSNKVTLTGGINAANGTQSLQIEGINIGNVDLTNQDNIATAINGNVTLQSRGVFAVVSASGGVEVYNNTGADISVGVIDKDGSSAATITATGMNGETGTVEADSHNTVYVSNGVNATNNSQTLEINGISLGVLDLTNSSAMATAINNNATLWNQGVHAVDRGGGIVSIHNYTAADISITITDEDGVTASGLSARGIDGVTHSVVANTRNIVTLSNGTNAGNNTDNLSINGVSLGNLDLTDANAVATAINNNSSLNSLGVKASESGGNLLVHNHTAADIVIGISDRDGLISSGYDARGLSGSSIAVRADAVDALRLSGGVNADDDSQTLDISSVSVADPTNLTSATAIANALNSNGYYAIVSGSSVLMALGNYSTHINDDSATSDAKLKIEYISNSNVISTYNMVAGDGGIAWAGFSTPTRSDSETFSGQIVGNTQIFTGFTSNKDEASFAGTISVALAQGYTISSDIQDGLFSSGPANEAVSATKAGYKDTSDGNAVGDQVLSIHGPSGTSTVSITENTSAIDIAAQVNAATAQSGIIADAKTTATLFDLTSPGTVSFTLIGSNTPPAIPISATVTNNTEDPPGGVNMTELVKAINQKTGSTGVTARFGNLNNKIVLEQAEGYDIEIADFEIDSAVDAHDQSRNPLLGNGSNINAEGIVQSIKILGNEGDEASANELFDGGRKTTYNSTVIGGEITFYGSDVFTIESSVDPTTAGESIFQLRAAEETTSTLSSFIIDVDILTPFNAAKTLLAIDGSIRQVDTIRGYLGALQNRFESNISNLQNISENLSAARSRILDADIAAETSAMTKQNILQQAGVSILSQANQQPQLALSLLGNQ